ncbi:MAG: hypothetical protein WA749_13855, partial [Gelidibacter sp.]
SKPLNNKKKNNRTINNILLSEVDTSDLEDSEIEYFEIAKVFRDLFIKNLKEKNAPVQNQETAKFKNYVDPIRLMMENDNVTNEQLKKVFKYLSSPEGDFWKANILSTKKLREKFSQLIMKCETETKNTEARQSSFSQNRPNISQGGASPEYRRKTAERLGLINPEASNKQYGGYRHAHVDAENLIKELEEDAENGNIPGQY